MHHEHEDADLGLSISTSYAELVGPLGAMSRYRENGRYSRVKHKTVFVRPSRLNARQRNR